MHRGYFGDGKNGGRFGNKTVLRSYSKAAIKALRSTPHMWPFYFATSGVFPAMQYQRLIEQRGHPSPMNPMRPAASGWLKFCPFAFTRAEGIEVTNHTG